MDHSPAIMRPSAMMGLFLTLLLLPTAYAQTSSGEIKGRVYDEEQKEWMTAASVRLLSASDSTLVQGVMTDKQGHFRLSVSTPGSYLVDISFIGYTPYSKAVSIGKSTKVDLGKIKLSPTATALSELKVVGQSSPVTIKKDTVQFSAGAFKVRPGASVEELLRRIPGIEVDAEGNITYNGESIERVELDGRDIFSSDPTMATKNLPADLIKNVQVVDKKSEQTRLTGMDDGEKTKILNLNVKEELKKRSPRQPQSRLRNQRPLQSRPDGVGIQGRRARHSPRQSQQHRWRTTRKRRQKAALCGSQL